jgi:hypothetical protein
MWRPRFRRRILPVTLLGDERSGILQLRRDVLPHVQSAGRESPEVGPAEARPSENVVASDGNHAARRFSVDRSRGR